MKPQPVFAIADAHGRALIEVEGTIEQAVEQHLSRHGREAPLFFDGDLNQLQKNGTESSRKANPPPDALMALRALGESRVAQGPISLKEVYRRFPEGRKGLQDAFREVQHYLPQPGQISLESYERQTFKVHGGEYSKPSSFASALLSSNAKTTKAESGDAGIPPSLSMGLAFAPHTLLREPRMQAGVQFLETEETLQLRKSGKTLTRVPVAGQHFVKPPTPPSGFKTVCVGASLACRNSCLLYSGQNQAVESNNAIKAMRLQAFLKAPEAFIRLYHHSLVKFVKDCDKNGLDPYVRHNILSDLPWEIICPDLMRLPWDKDRRGKAPVRFYDYTKVVGRDTSKSVGYIGRSNKLRYDLTFSFSGENWSECESEFMGGKRIAVVFLRAVQKKKKSGGYTGETLDDIRVDVGGKLRHVIDGDKHDMRPLDPAPAIIGLRFKARQSMVWSTKEQKMVLRTVKEQKEQASEFAKRPGKPVEGQHWLIQGFRDAQGNIMVAETPRQTCGDGDVARDIA